MDSTTFMIAVFCVIGDFLAGKHLRNPSARPLEVKQLARNVPKQDWVRATIKEGSKGPIVCDFAFLRVTESPANLPASEL